MRIAISFFSPSSYLSGENTFHSIFEYSSRLLGFSLSQEDFKSAWSPVAARPYAVTITFSWALILFSNIFFFIHLTLMWLRLGRRSSHPTLLVAHHGSGSPHGEEGDIDNAGPAHAH